jgi:hypothetical protein
MGHFWETALPFKHGRKWVFMLCSDASAISPPSIVKLPQMGR